MKKLILASTLALSATSFAALDVESEIKQLKDKLEKLEYDSLSNNVKFGGQLETRYDYTSKNDKVAPGSNNSTGLYSNYFRLNMSAKASDNIEFFGRLSMAKFWNDIYENYAGRPDLAGSNSGSAGRGRSSSAIFAERAFVNWKLSDSWTFTFGRLPTIDGAPKHFAVGTSAMGTYPLVAYGTIFDGVALTKAFKGNDWELKARVVYTPLQSPNFGGFTTANVDTKGNKINPHSDLIVFNADLEVKNLGFADRWNSVLQTLYTDSYPTASYATSASTITAANLDVGTKAVTLYNELNNVLDLGLDLYGSFKYSQRTSQGLSTTAQGFYSSTSYATYHSTNIWVGFRQKIFSKHYFGLEYINNSKKSYVPDSVYQDLVNLYATPASNAFNLFATINFDSHLTGVFGVSRQHIQNTFTGGVYGDGANADVVNNSGYARLIASF